MKGALLNKKSNSVAVLFFFTAKHSNSKIRSNRDIISVLKIVASGAYEGTISFWGKEEERKKSFALF
jgi:hypothetical protein